WIWAGIMGLLVVIAALGYWIVNLQTIEFDREGVAEVPVVVSFTEEAAVAAIEEVGLTPLVLREVNALVPEGQVIRTDPAAGSKMKEGFQVNIYVSSGAQRARVPNLQGMTLKEAEAALIAQGLELGTAKKSTSPEIAADRVIS